MLLEENISQLVNMLLQGVGFGFAGALFAGLASWVITAACRVIIKVLKG